VIRQIGLGGMGAVYEVEHTLTKHRRALKLLHAEMAAIPAIVTRFLREASAAGHIGNPHVVETFDAGQLDDGEPYGFGLVLLFVGIGFVVLWYFEERQMGTRSGAPGPGPGGGA
jgi:serine/threonine-protein kinase